MFVFMIWLGSLLPEAYYQSIVQCNDYFHNQCVLLQQPYQQPYMQKYSEMFNIKANLTLLNERTDLLKLLYLYEKGGIYTDVANKVDYRCFNEWISNQQQSFFFGEIDQQPTSFFIYSPAPKNPQLEKIIKQILNCTNCFESALAETQFLKKMKVNSINVSDCVTPNYYNQNSSVDQKQLSWQDQYRPITTKLIEKCQSEFNACKHKSNRRSKCENERVKLGKKIKICQKQTQIPDDVLKGCQDCFNLNEKHLRNTEQKWELSKKFIIGTALAVCFLIGYAIGYIYLIKSKKTNLKQKRSIKIQSQLESQSQFEKIKKQETERQSQE